MADYVSLSELKAALRINDNEDNTLLETAITSASAWVDGWCNRSFEAAGTAVTYRDYIPTGTFETLFIDDAVEITEIRVDDDLDGSFADTLTSVDWQAEPVNSTTGGLSLPYTRIKPFEDGYWPTWRGQATVRVYARYGWPAVPAAVKTAIFDQMSPEHIAFMLSKIPMGRFGMPAEVAAMVSWLCTDECSFTTGAVFDLSGGRATY